MLGQILHPTRSSGKQISDQTRESHLIIRLTLPFAIKEHEMRISESQDTQCIACFTHKMAVLTT